MPFSFSPELQEIMFSKKLKEASLQKSRQQMTHTQSSTQDREASFEGFEKNLYDKSSIYKAAKDAITAPMRAYEGEFDVDSPYAVQEAMNTAGMATLGGMPGGAKGPGSVGSINTNVSSQIRQKLIQRKINEGLEGGQTGVGGYPKQREKLDNKPSLEDRKKLEEFFTKEVLEKTEEAPEFKSRSKVILMPVDHFLAMALPLIKPDPSKQVNIKNILSKEKLKNPLLLLADNLGGYEQIIGHEGRHRALAMKERGITHVPVEYKSRRIRWSEQDNPDKFDYLEEWPTILRSEDGKKKISFPIDRQDVELVK